MNTFENQDFSWELSNIYHMVENSSNRSILLIDEFGKNTDFVNWISLFCSLIQNLNQPYFETNYSFMNQDNDQKDNIYDKIPISIFVTHFHDIFHKNLLNENYITRFLTMDI